MKDNRVVAVFKLPCYGIAVNITESNKGSIVSNLHTIDDKDYDSAVKVIESLILAHACSGVDICAKEYIKGIESCVEAITNIVADS